MSEVKEKLNQLDKPRDDTANGQVQSSVLVGCNADGTGNPEGGNQETESGIRLPDRTPHTEGQHPFTLPPAGPSTAVDSDCQLSSFDDDREHQIYLQMGALLRGLTCESRIAKMVNNILAFSRVLFYFFNFSFQVQALRVRPTEPYLGLQEWRFMQRAELLNLYCAYGALGQMRCGRLLRLQAL